MSVSATASCPSRNDPDSLPQLAIMSRLEKLETMIPRRRFLNGLIAASAASAFKTLNGIRQQRYGN